MTSPSDSALAIFEYGSFAVRTVVIDGEPWFVLADLCAVLDLSNPTVVAGRLDGDDLSSTEVIDSMGRPQVVTIINEAGMYDVILDSRKPEAKTFRRWLVSEVLPAIRKTGKYEVEELTELEQAERYLELASSYVEVVREKARIVEELAIAAPRAEIAERWLESSESSIHVVEWAKKFGMKQNAMYKLLRDNDVVFKQKDPRARGEFIQAAKGGYEDCFEPVDEWLAGPRRWKTVLLVTPSGQIRLAEELGLVEE